MLIEMKDIHKTYGNGDVSREALKGISLQVEQGDYVAVMGTSGSGKTTLLNIIGCMDTATSGSYMFENTDVTTLKGKKLDDFRKQHISFVFQQFALMGQYTVYENVELPLLCQNISKKIRQEKIQATLERMGIAHLKNKEAALLSGGEQQRCAIARALVAEHDLILADEPTGALDRKTGEEIMKCFDEMHQVGKTVILVTHDEQIAAHAKRIIRIEDGLLSTAF